MDSGSGFVQERRYAALTDALGGGETTVISAGESRGAERRGGRLPGWKAGRFPNNVGRLPRTTSRNERGNAAMRTPKWLVALVVPALVCLLGAEWQTYVSKPGSYKVKFPGKPKEMDSDAGMGIKMKMAILEQDNNAYAVIYADLPFPGDELPPEVVEAALDGARQGALGSQKNSKLISEKKIKVDGKHSGRDIVMAFDLPDGNRGRVRVKVFLVGKTLYQVMVAGSEDFVKGKDTDTFIDSFTLTK